MRFGCFAEAELALPLLWPPMLAVAAFKLVPAESAAFSAISFVYCRAGPSARVEISDVLLCAAKNCASAFAEFGVADRFTAGSAAFCNPSAGVCFAAEPGCSTDTESPSA